VPTDIHVLREDELERWRYLGATAFMSSAEPWERATQALRPEWTLVATVDGEMQASVTSIPSGLELEGNKAAMGAVSGVACMPEYRRMGLVAELLVETLKRSRDLGEPLSGLWTPHPALYRRYGWETATDVRLVSFAPKQLALAPGPRPTGRIRRPGENGWQEAARVYREWAGRRNSLMTRDAARWAVLVSEPETVLYHYVSADGAPEGFALLQTTRAEGAAGLTVRDLVATSSEAYRALVGLVLSHDLVAKVDWYCSVDEPLAEALADPAPARSRLERGLMLRIVDVAEALGRRPAYAEGRLMVRVVDEVCPWNDGVWEVTAAGSRFSVEREDDEPMLTLDVRALAQLFNGYRSATQLARAGRIQAHHARAVAIADIMFAMRTPPFCADEF